MKIMAHWHNKISCALVTGREWKSICDYEVAVDIVSYEEREESGPLRPPYGWPLSYWAGGAASLGMTGKQHHRTKATNATNVPINNMKSSIVWKNCGFKANCNTLFQI